MGLAVTVCLYDEHRELHAFGPGDDVPEWARKRITNPAAWEHSDHVHFATEPAVTPSSDGAGVSAPTVVQTPATPAGPPPQDGPGASRLVWEEYATAHGVTVEADWKRGDIIAACELAGVPV